MRRLPCDPRVWALLLDQKVWRASLIPVANLLHSQRIKALLDIKKSPKSRHCPRFLPLGHRFLRENHHFSSPSSASPRLPFRKYLMDASIKSPSSTCSIELCSICSRLSGGKAGGSLERGQASKVLSHLKILEYSASLFKGFESAVTTCCNVIAGFGTTLALSNNTLELCQLLILQTLDPPKTGLSRFSTKNFEHRWFDPFCRRAAACSAVRRPTRGSLPHRTGKGASFASKSWRVWRRDWSERPAGRQVFPHRHVQCIYKNRRSQVPVCFLVL